MDFLPVEVAHGAKIKISCNNSNGLFFSHEDFSRHKRFLAVYHLTISVSDTWQKISSLVSLVKPQLFFFLIAFVKQTFILSKRRSRNFSLDNSKGWRSPFFFQKATKICLKKQTFSMKRKFRSNVFTLNILCYKNHTFQKHNPIFHQKHEQNFYD